MKAWLVVTTIGGALAGALLFLPPSTAQQSEQQAAFEAYLKHEQFLVDNPAATKGERDG